MKMRLFILISILLTISGIIMAPVAAATTGTTAVTGNPKVAVSITLNLTSVYLDLDPAVAQPITNGSLGITISSNTAQFFINVNDSSARPGAEQGWMGNSTGGVYETGALATNLSAALNLTGTTNGTTTGQAITPPLAGQQLLYDGNGKVTDQVLAPNTFSQIVAYADERLPTNYVYRMDLVFEIGAT